MSTALFITRTIPHIAVQELEEKGYIVDMYDGEAPLSQDELIARLSQKPYEGLICMMTDVIDAKVFDAAPALRIVSLFTVRGPFIDVAEAKRRGIIVANTAGVPRTAIAEHTVALMLGLTTRLAEADIFVREGKYTGWDPMIFTGTDLKGKVVGIVGAGSIGMEVARMVHHGFDAKVIYQDIAANPEIEAECAAVRIDTVDELVRTADIISLHVPLMDTTRHLIDAQRLQMMKPTSFLINTSRGAVVDEAALVEALRKGTIAGAGLDVYEHEPTLAPGLADLHNVILTPHIASAKEQTRNQMATAAAENIISFFEGKNPRTIIEA